MLLVKKVPYLTALQIEQKIEQLLDVHGMTPTDKNPVLDLEKLIQGPLKAILDDYAELPAEIMGQVEFDPDCRDHVKINRDLSELADSGEVETAATAQARRRSTIAHEAGHIILHRDILMPVIDQQSLFPTAAGESSDVGACVYRCLKSDFGLRKAVAPRPNMRTQGGFASTAIDHMEIQANKAMAALLVPRAVFCAIALPRLQEWERRRQHTDAGIHFHEGRALIHDFARHFQVSLQVIEIQIKALNLSAQSKIAVLPTL
jgi:hypothetical protein